MFAVKRASAEEVTLTGADANEPYIFWRIWRVAPSFVALCLDEREVDDVRVIATSGISVSVRTKK